MRNRDRQKIKLENFLPPFKEAQSGKIALVISVIETCGRFEFYRQSHLQHSNGDIVEDGGLV
jgi:hypothetical protein